jgi:lysylphosphatidylglycerol synthetase-like protein (DUF2156 family)
VLAAFGLLDPSSPHATLVFLIGHAAGAASLMPGGLGAADAAWIYGLSTRQSASRVAAAILVFRFFYYVVPFVLAAFVVVTRDTGRRPRALRAARAVCSLAFGAAGVLVLASVATPGIASRLHAVSDAWLETKRVAEKRFSVGFFDPDYLRRFPALIAEMPGGGIVAFANLLPGASGGEASIDLMRQRPGAPGGVMDAVIVSAIEWAKAQGYARFSLGMAPLSTVGESRRAPLWERASRIVFASSS